MNSPIRIKTPIYLIGFMGSGKSTIGQKISRILSYTFVDLDQYIVQKHGQTIAELFQHSGEEGFRKLEREALEELSDRRDCVIACGGGTPCYSDNMQLMNQRGTTLYLQTDEDVLYQRLKHSSTERPLIAGKSDEELKESIKRLMEVRRHFYEQAKFHIDGNRPNPERLISLIKFG